MAIPEDSTQFFTDWALNLRADHQMSPGLLFFTGFAPGKAAAGCSGRRFLNTLAGRMVSRMKDAETQADNDQG